MKENRTTGRTAMHKRGALWIGAAAAAIVVGLVLWQNPFSKKDEPGTPPVEETFFPPPLTASRFLNTGPDAQYIGTEACAKCHQREHHSYQLTPHSRALSDLDPKAEPADGSFFHRPSGRHYRIYRQGDIFRHEEVARAEDGSEIARLDVPIRYLIGSGNFCRSYLAEIDGFLHESPVTWYTSKKKWDMSPGYDFPKHHSFERPVTVGCLSCHAGRVEPIGDTAHQVSIHEKAIGCESCHGPGSLHAKHRQSKQGGKDEEDLTIVNPARMSRAELESMCAVCHLNTVASIPIRGRRIGDYRPGLRITDFRIDYAAKNESGQMTVVGHIEQLRASACYQKSDDLTCLTCHDPHAREKPVDVGAFYRQKCLNCHDSKPCKLPEPERVKKDCADNCIACHMPRSDTDIPHIAFSHHRIGHHSGKKETDSPGVPELTPTLDDSHLSTMDRKRNLGLAYVAAAAEPRHSQHAEALREQARTLLAKFVDAGSADAEAKFGLAKVYWHQQEFARAAEMAREALAGKDLSGNSRGAALLILADTHLRSNQIDAGLQVVEQLVRVRRYAEDWRLLGFCHMRKNQHPQALAALQKALEIRPFRHDIHSMIGDVYLQMGDQRRARDHYRKANWLLSHGQE